jgi:hypothetical protein
MTPWLFIGSLPTAATVPPADEDWFADGTVPLEWTLSRAGPALGRGGDGRWASFAANVPRPYTHPTSFDYLGTLVESQARTQLVHRSRAADGTVGIAPVAATAGTDPAVQTPFGLGATRIVPTTAAAEHGFGLPSGSALMSPIGDNATVSFRFVFRFFGPQYETGLFILTDRTNTTATVLFTTAGGGAATPGGSRVAASLEPDRDGFWELRMTMAYQAGTTAPACNLLLLPASGTRSHAGDGTSGILVAYLGAEIGPDCTSPILTDGTVAVTRAPDALACAPDWLGPGAKTFGLQYTPLSDAPTAILSGFGPDLLDLRQEPTGLTFTAATAGAAAGQVNLSAQLSGPSPAVRSERTVVVVAGPDEFRLVSDGTVLATDSAGAVPSSLSALRIGAEPSGANAGAVVLRRLKYWRRSLSGPEARVFSTDLSAAGREVVRPALDIQPTRAVPPSETTVALVVGLTGVPTGPGVSWRTVDATAVAGVDYVGARGAVTFAPGSYAARIDVALASRSTAADRTFFIDLIGPAGAVLGPRRCAVTLRRAARQEPVAAVANTFGAALPAEWSLTRGGAARARNAAGAWVAVAANAPRHHFLTPAASGLLVEPAAAEQRLYDGVDPGFVATASTKALDTATAVPTGTRSLRWRIDGTATAHKMTLALSASNSDMPTGEFTLSAIVRPVGGLPYWTLRTKGIDNVWMLAVYGLSGAGSVVLSDTGTVAAVEADPILPGWYTVSMDRAQAGSAGVGAEIELFPSDALGNPAAVAAGNEFSGDFTAEFGAPSEPPGIDVAHLQVEPGAGYSSPIVPAPGATAKTVRAADVLRATGTWFQRRTYSLGIRFARLRDVPTVQRVFQSKDIPSGGVDNDVVNVEGGVVLARLHTAGADLPTLVGGANVRGAPHTALLVVDHAARFALFDAGAKRGETPVGVAGAASPLTVTSLRIGAGEPTGANPASLLVQAVRQWTAALPDADAAPRSGNLAYAAPPPEEPPPLVGIPAALSAAEGGTVTVPVTKAGAGACSVRFRTVAHAATPGADYTAVDQTVSFGSSDTVVNIPVQVSSDAAADPGETFRIELVAGTAFGCVLGNAIGTVTVA